jgi:hypothetical protein
MALPHDPRVTAIGVTALAALCAILAFLFVMLARSAY